MDSEQEIVVCFYGSIVFMDTFLLKSIVRCIIIPIQRHFQGKVKFRYMIHTFLTDTTLGELAQFCEEFTFSKLYIEFKTIKSGENLYSLLQTRNMWANSQKMVILYLRLDVLPTRVLSSSDIQSLTDDESTIIVSDFKSTKICFMMGKSDVMSKFIDILSQQETSSDISAYCKLQQIRVIGVNIPLLRILKDGSIHKRDSNICPYINDLLLSSSTKIKLVQKKISYT